MVAFIMRDAFRNNARGCAAVVRRHFKPAAARYLLSFVLLFSLSERKKKYRSAEGNSPTT
jgi:hypothetical protein